jgi:hypothetical protein
MKILLGGFNAKVGRESIFKPTVGNEILHQESNDNGVSIAYKPFICIRPHVSAHCFEHLQVASFTFHVLMCAKIAMSIFDHVWYCRV